MRFHVLPVTAFAQNCTLVWNADLEAFIVDPGGEAPRILEAVTERALRPRAVLLTHGHLDHVGAAATVAQAYDIPILGPQAADRPWIESLADQARMFGLPPAPSFEPDRWLEAGERLALGVHEFEVRHCPGHTPGHLIFVDEDANLALVGDVLFQGGIGRTDLPMGDPQALLDSIRDYILTLDDATRVIPGHGPLTTVGAERAHNPFLAELRP